MCGLSPVQGCAIGEAADGVCASHGVHPCSCCGPFTASGTTLTPSFLLFADGSQYRRYTRGRRKPRPCQRRPHPDRKLKATRLKLGAEGGVRARCCRLEHHRSLNVAARPASGAQPSLLPDTLCLLTRGCLPGFQLAGSTQSKSLDAGPLATAGPASRHWRLGTRAPPRRGRICHARLASGAATTFHQTRSLHPLAPPHLCHSSSCRWYAPSGRPPCCHPAAILLPSQPHPGLLLRRPPLRLHHARRVVSPSPSLRRRTYTSTVTIGVSGRIATAVHHHRLALRGMATCDIPLSPSTRMGVSPSFASVGHMPNPHCHALTRERCCGRRLAPTVRTAVRSCATSSAQSRGRAAPLLFCARGLPPHCRHCACTLLHTAAAIATVVCGGATVLVCHPLAPVAACGCRSTPRGITAIYTAAPTQSLSSLRMWLLYASTAVPTAHRGNHASAARDGDYLPPGGLRISSPFGVLHVAALPHVATMRQPCLDHASQPSRRCCVGRPGCVGCAALRSHSARSLGR